MRLTDEFKNMLAEAFASSSIEECDITTCDSCENLVLTEHSHKHHGSMGKECTLCPECDLPEKWSSKYSNGKGKRFYVYSDPLRPDASYVQWGHPTEGNPLYIHGDKGEPLTKRKRQKCQQK